MNSQAMRVAKEKPHEGENSNFIQALIKGLLVIVTAGYFFIWIIMPMNMYRRKWSPWIIAHTMSTYLGIQGPTILVYTFPALFVAVLSCLYLHLAKKKIYTIKSNVVPNRLAMRRRPLIIKRLGIVSRIELAFFVMFVALLIWYFSAYLYVTFSIITPISAEKRGEKVWQSKLNGAALRLGFIGNLCLAFLFFPVTRGSSILRLFGLTSEASIKYHIWLGHLVMTFFTAHGFCYIIYWAVTNHISEMLKWEKVGTSHVAGEIALVAGLVIWATTYPSIRRKKFELFFYTHHLYILFVFFFILHVGITFACIMLPSFYLFLVDRYLRFLQSQQSVRLVSARVLPCETVELNFSKTKGQTYSPTSIVFLNLPAISRLQWHPFTVCSSSSLEHETLSVIIKGEGSWTKKLYQMLSLPKSIDHIDASIEGPYGPSSLDFLRHEMLVMISGGSGITPYIAIIRELIHAKEAMKYNTPNNILIIASFKNSLDLTMLNLLLPMSGSTVQISKLGLLIEAYVTREKHLPTTDIKKNIIPKWFKPKPSSLPIAPILGQNNWLWLGAIISSSFIIFLLLIGIITRFYIYPIDHNTNAIYPNSYRAMLNILFVCISITITSSAAYLWNKKENAKELSKEIIQNLESLPQQSNIALLTNVHYGERPDLKRILFERKESSVGVVVSGPKKMRHDVAKICSSGLADNLHFESISFSW